MEKERIPPPPSRDRTWVACTIHQRDNHYTTPTADSVSEIKYLYMYPCLLWETSVVKSSNCFQRCIARYCIQRLFWYWVVVDLVILTDPKLIKLSQTWHLSIWYMKQIIQITQHFSFSVCNSIKYEKIEEKMQFFTHNKSNSLSNLYNWSGMSKYGIWQTWNLSEFDRPKICPNFFYKIYHCISQE